MPDQKQQYAVKKGKTFVAYYSSEEDANAARSTYGEECTVEEVDEGDPANKESTPTVTTKNTTAVTSSGDDPTAGGKKKVSG